MHKTSKMGRNTTDKCRRGCGLKGTFFHTLWDCPHIQRFWAELLECMGEVLDCTLQPSPKWCLLNIWTPLDINRMERIWTTLGFIVAKRNIVRLWGAINPPRLQDWKQDMDWSMLAEKTIYEGRGCPRKWEKIWVSWNNYRGYDHIMAD